MGKNHVEVLCRIVLLFYESTRWELRLQPVKKVLFSIYLLRNGALLLLFFSLSFGFRGR